MNICFCKSVFSENQGGFELILAYEDQFCYEVVYESLVFILDDKYPVGLWPNYQKRGRLWPKMMDL